MPPGVASLKYHSGGGRRAVGGGGKGEMGKETGGSPQLVALGNSDLFHQNLSVLCKMG
jgi:hypothetical protein